MKNDYQTLQSTKQLLVQRGLDASKLRSDEVWTGLFTPANNDSEVKGNV